MELKDSILGRRSIRKYDPKKEVSSELIGEILETARFSPSSANMQSWKVIIVTDKKTRVKLANCCKGQDWIMEAPVHLVICNEYEKPCDVFGEHGKMFSIQNCAILATNIMNLAHEAGLGSCWIGSFSSDSVNRALDIPAKVDPEVILTLGYSVDTGLKASKRKSIFDISFFEKWGNTGAESKSLFAKLKEKFSKN